jgi:hypothetical protein
MTGLFLDSDARHFLVSKRIVWEAPATINPAEKKG